MAFGADTGRYLEMTILLRAVNQTGSTFSNVALAATAMAAAIGAGLAYSVKAAADFQSGLTLLSTGAGEAQKNLQAVGDGLKQISINTGESAGDLEKAMFEVESAGYRLASGGLQVMQTAAEGATIEHADLTKTTDVLITTLHNYHLAASQAVPVMNSLIETEKNGVMNLDQLNAAMTNVLPVAGAYHIKLSDIEGALATMAASGDKGAQGGTHLATMLRTLEQPSATVVDLMNQMGLSSVAVAQEMQVSLPGTIQMIEDAIANHFVPGSVQYNQALQAIFGGVRSARAGIELANQNLSLFNKNAEDAANVASHAGSSVQGWSQVQQDFNQQLSETQAGLNVAAIDLGTLLLPQLEKVLAAVNPLIAQFTNWVETSQGLHTAISSVGNFLAGVLVPAIANGAIWIGNFAMGAAHLYQAFQQGAPYANAIAIALGTIGTALVLIKIEETVAGWVNWFNAMRDGNGIIANIASQSLPELGAALGWTRVQADEVSAAMTRIGATTTASSIESIVALAQVKQAELDIANALAQVALEEHTQAATSLADAQAQEAYIAENIALIQEWIDKSYELSAAERAVFVQSGGAIDLRMALEDAKAEALSAQAAVAAAEEAELASMTEVARTAAAQVDAVSASTEATTAAAEAEMVAGSAAASTAITIAMGAATLGISLLVGAVIAGIAATAASGQNTIGEMTKQTQDLYNHLGNSADDTAAKQKAAAVTTSGTMKASADDATSRWQYGYRQMQIASDNAKAQMILNAQQTADEMDKAYQEWSNFVNQFSRQFGVYAQTGQKVAPPGPTILPGGPHPTGHASGVMNAPFGHFAMVGERGPELMYVPKGSNIYPNGTGPGGTTINVHVSTLAGSRAEVSRMVDLIERELAGRFRSQTPGFGYSGIV